MPASWESVASNPEFQALPPDQKVVASKQYFDTVVAPKVPKEHLAAAQQQFADHVKETTPRSFVESTEQRAGAALDQKPSGMASFIRKKVLGFDPLTPLDKAAGVAAAPLGAAGETAERKVGQIAGANPVKLEKAARATGDVSENLLSILPGAKVAKGAEAVGDVAAASGQGVAKGAETMKMGYKAREAELLDKSVADMDAKSDAAAAKMRDMGVKFKPETAQQLAAHIEDSWKEASLGKPDLKLHGESMEVLADIKAASKKGFDMQDLDNFRKRFRQIANKGGEDAKFAGEALDAMRTAAENFKSKLPPGSTFLPYVDQYAKARRFDTLADIVKNSGGDPQKIKSGFQKLLKSDKKMRGFTDEEKKAIEEAAHYTTPEKLMRLAGRFGYEIGGDKTAPAAVLPTTEALYGWHYGSPYTVPAIAGATAARYGGKLMARGKAERALQAVENRKISSDEALGAQTDPLVSGANP